MEYPKEIYLDGYTYTQMYEHEKGGMYYHSEEHEYGKYDFENNKKIGGL